MNYVAELQERKRMITKAIQRLSPEVIENPKPMDDIWMEKYNELASLRTDLATVKSRIRNFYKPRQLDIQIVIQKQI